jgi:hypothetical protein
VSTAGSPRRGSVVIASILRHGRRTGHPGGWPGLRSNDKHTFHRQVGKGRSGCLRRRQELETGYFGKGGQGICVGAVLS